MGEREGGNGQGSGILSKYNPHGDIGVYDALIGRGRREGEGEGEGGSRRWRGRERGGEG